MLRFRTKTTIEVINQFDEKTDVILDSEEMTFQQGERVDADIYNKEGDCCDIQFADGSVAIGVLRDSVEEV